MMDPVIRLLAIEDIKQLKARYFRCMDGKDWSGLLDVFTPDAQFDMSASWSAPDPATGQLSPPADERFRIDGRDAFIDLLRGAIGPLHTVHHGHMPEIDIVSDTQATGIWAMEDVIRNAAGQAEHHLHAYGHYHERYAKTGGRWAISAMRLTRLHFAAKVVR